MKDKPVWSSSACDESIDAVCPKCGKAISPAEVQRIDFERIECSACGERFAPLREDQRFKWPHKNNAGQRGVTG